MLIKETFEYIKETINEGIDRLKFLYNSSVISWTIFKWKAIFTILYSDKSFETRIIYVNTKYSDFCNNFLFPVLVALAYVFLFPFLKNWIYSLLKEVNNTNRAVWLIQ